MHRSNSEAEDIQKARPSQKPTRSRSNGCRSNGHPQTAVPCPTAGAGSGFDVQESGQVVDGCSVPTHNGLWPACMVFIWMKQLPTLVVLLLASFNVAACSCVRPDGSIEQQVIALYDASHVVGIFEVGGRSSSTRTFDGAQRTRRSLELVPRRLFKGEHSSMYAAAPPLLFRTSCDVTLRKGDLVLVYAPSSGPVSLSWCSPSGALLRKFEHLPVLFSLSEQWR